MSDYEENPGISLKVVFIALIGVFGVFGIGSFQSTINSVVVSQQAPQIKNTDKERG